MAKNETLTRVKEILGEFNGIKPSDINDTSELNGELGMDSLDIIDFIMEVEKEFNINVDDDHVEGIKTVVDVANYIDERTMR